MPSSQHRETHYCSGTRLDGAIVARVRAQKPSCGHPSSEGPFTRRAKHDERDSKDCRQGREHPEHQEFQRSKDGDNHHFGEKSTHAHIHLRM